MTGIVEDNDITGAHGGFIILEEGVNLICIIPTAVIAYTKLGIIGVVQIALALGVPPQDRHIIGIAGSTPKSHRQTV